MFERYDPRNWDFSWDSVIHAALAIGAPVLIALILHAILFTVLRRIARMSSTWLDDVILDTVRRPMRWAMAGWAISIAAHGDTLLGDGWERAMSYIAPALMGWVLFALVKGVAAGLERQAEDAEDPVAMRTRRTRISILSRTFGFAIILITISLIMLNIPGVRDIGVTLMASAGLAALAVGAAAQPALKSLIAGLQMALTQPLRLGDLVKVDGEVGRVEEIRMSFVTVRSWDERVLVVPTARFLDESFENWSRVSERLTGPVYLHLDPATAVQPIREEFERFVGAHALFDGRNLALLMTEAHPESIELRLSMSSATIGDLWTLRCETREHMIGWLQRNMPDALIRHRLEVQAANARTDG
ncbi:MAG: mechanosensitive ion channel family protein [Alphaproteobacteria bacterium]|nr:mechanosensitive ion channel family protein [Alphaproteobacteria bacterium]MBU1757340.1 mechanosensitive ion channel family protein [Alphaproteobacteria bacterium]MBU2032470.1 mechanosensitive ion channel family protein [Alphaproteobacteria bacterium]MBU2341498.1 mechanosensitive ion channel family protein [Alphaproteobacteria bacterium]